MTKDEIKVLRDKKRADDEARRVARAAASSETGEDAADDDGGETEAELEAEEELPEVEPVVPAVADEPPAPSVAEPEEPRSPLLAGIDPDIAALFSPEELAEIEREAREDARKQAKARALKTIKAKARQHALSAEGLIPEDKLRDEAEQRRLDERVRIKINLPGGGAGHRDHGLRIDQRLYLQGSTYTVTRAEFESMSSIHYQRWLHELRFRTLDQSKTGNSARELALNGAIPPLEVPNYVH